MQENRGKNIPSDEGGIVLVGVSTSYLEGNSAKGERHHVQNKFR